MIGIVFTTENSEKKGKSFSDDNLTDLRDVYNKVVLVVDDENERTIENTVVIDNGTSPYSKTQNTTLNQ